MIPDYQELFEHMANYHDVVLLESQIEDILTIADRINKQREIELVKRQSERKQDGEQA